MLIKLDEYDLKEIKKMEKVIGKCKTIQVGEDYYIDPSEIMGMIEDFNYEYERLEEKFLELDRDVQDNYKRITPAEQYGVSDRDFI